VPAFELTPLRITVIYLAFGMVALYLSDVLVVDHLSEPLLSQVQTLKGGVEVLLTGGLIFALTSRSQNQLRDANARLERRRGELQHLHRVLRHNLRNDLNVIHGYGEMIHGDIPTDRLEKRCEHVLETAERMERYTEQAQRIRKVSEAADRRQVVDLAETIPAILADNPLVTSEVAVTRTLPDVATVRTHPMIEEAIDELVTNAIKHSDAETPAIDIEITVENGLDNLTELRITDNGPGIPESEATPLRKETQGPLHHPSGMGLWFVNWVVTHSDGRLRITNGDEGGTNICIRLPSEPPPSPSERSSTGSHS
jgi:signal transduction histidine kinase